MKQLSLFTEQSPEQKSGHETMWQLFCDGAARGNPGPAGLGISISRNGERYIEEGYALGQRTNNQAEYLALLVGLLHIMHVYKTGDRLTVYSDSQLLVRQVQGIYAVRDTNLKVYADAAKRILATMPYTIHHVPRAHNSRADACANQGVDNDRALPAVFVQALHLVCMGRPLADVRTALSDAEHPRSAR